MEHTQDKSSEKGAKWMWLLRPPISAAFMQVRAMPKTSGRQSEDDTASFQTSKQ